MSKWFALLFLLPSLLLGQATVPWLTRSHDNQRTGWNNQETLLTEANVEAKGIYLKTTIPLCCDARGAEAQPLFVPSVKTAKGTFDLLLACSMSNDCRAVDKHDGSGVWDIKLGFAVNGGTNIDGWLINQHWGALSTGVIDQATGKWYQVFWMSPDGSGNANTARYYMAVISLYDGAYFIKPIVGSDQGFDFTAIMRKARSSAVLLNQNGTKTVIQCTGTVSETSNGASGFCFAFDTYTNTIKAMKVTTPGRGGGLWEAGQGLSCSPDSSFCYAETGNGDFDGNNAWGESFIQLKYNIPTPTTNYNGTITITKGFSPFTDFQRTGQTQQQALGTNKIAGMSAPSEAINKMPMVSMKNAKLKSYLNQEGQYITLVYPDMAQGPWADEDVGSGGPACIFQIGYCIASGKDGIAYSIEIPNFIGTTATNVGTKANYANVADCTWLTVDPGPIDPCPANAKLLNVFPNGDTAHMHMTPVQMYDPLLKSWTIFAWGENQQLHKWKVGNDGSLTWVANGEDYASDLVRANSPGGMPGGFCAGSSNGSASPILVCAYPHYNANKIVRDNSGVIVIYDPIHLDAEGHIKKIWSSSWYNWNIWFNKFMPPVIDGGQIYYANYNGGIMVMNLVGH